jgi:hypothetical protein
MNGRIQKRFEKMALRANSKAGIVPDQCKWRKYWFYLPKIGIN